MSIEQEKRAARIAEKAVDSILDDLSSRSGLSDAWDSIDRRTQDEIVKKFEKIVVKFIEEDGAL